MEVLISSSTLEHSSSLTVELFANYVRATNRNLVTLKP
jgi:hypothetical protein